MRHIYTYLVASLLFVSLCFNQLQAEGFCSTTLVKTVSGYKSIKDLHVDDGIICCDATKNCIEGSVSGIIKKSIEQYVCIHIADECICLAGDQRLYDEKNDSWIAAASLRNDDILAGHVVTVELINEPIDVYLVSVARYHNFFVSSLNVCAHNFMPVIIGISVLLGSGGFEIAGITFGVAGLGGYLGYRWHKNNKQQHDIVLSAMSFDIVQETNDIYHANDAQAPGMPTEKDGYYPPKKWDGKKKIHPINGAVGWPDKKGKIWVPTGVGPKAHGGPHWDVQYPNGIDYDNVYPGGKIRPG